jgi:hypothetical protein
MTPTSELKRLAEAADESSLPLPFEIEQWLITIKAHCLIISDHLSDQTALETVQCLRMNVDLDLRPVLLSLIARLEKAEAALIRLGSSEAFGNSFYNDGKSSAGKKLIRRIEYARAALEKP